MHLAGVHLTELAKPQLLALLLTWLLMLGQAPKTASLLVAVLAAAQHLAVAADCNALWRRT